MGKGNFEWVAFYKELANKILAYKNLFGRICNPSEQGKLEELLGVIDKIK